MAAGGLSSLRQWLGVVNKHLTPEGLEFVKLCVYSEIEYGEYETITIPSDLFDHLLHKCYQSDEAKTLQVFTYALKHVGRDLHGVYLVDRRMSECGLTSPPPLEEDMLSKEFKFCLCLVKIGTKSRGMEIELKLTKHFSRRSFLDLNHGNLQHLPDVFVRLMQEKKILWNETQLLQKAFENYGAKQCLRYLNEYHKKVGLPPITSVDGDKEETFSESSANPTDISESLRFNDSIRPKSKRVRHDQQLPETEMRTLVHGPPTKAAPTSGPGNLTPPQNAGVPADQLESENDITTDQPNTENDDSNNGYHAYGKKCRRLCWVWIVASVLCAAFFGVFFGTTWIKLIPRSLEHVRGRESTTIILGEENQFFTQEVQVFEDLVSTDPHVFDIYRVKSKCAELPSERNLEIMKKLTNFSNMYFLPGSTVDLDLILFSSNLTTSNDYIVVYFTSGLEAVFNPHQIQGQIIWRERIGFDGQSHPFSYNVPDTGEGYYNLHFLFVPSTPFDYTLNLTVYNVSINVAALSSSDHVCTIDNEKVCSIQFDFSASTACLVADISSTNATDPFLEIDLKVVSFQLVPVLFITLFLFVMVIVVIVIVTGCVSYRVCRTSFSNPTLS